jgi:hypothetical protein
MVLPVLSDFVLEFQNFCIYKNPVAPENSYKMLLDVTATCERNV